MGPCTGLYGTTALTGDKAATELKARWPHPGHLTVSSSKPPVLGKPLQPRGMGTFPSPRGTRVGDTEPTAGPQSLWRGCFPSRVMW